MFNMSFGLASIEQLTIELHHPLSVTLLVPDEKWLVLVSNMHAIVFGCIIDCAVGFEPIYLLEKGTERSDMSVTQR